MNKASHYAVVEFLSETVDDQMLAQELPASWLCDDNTKCWWPPKNSNKEIRGATDPDVASWQKFDVRLKKIYGNFQEAREKCLMSSDFEEHEEMGKHMRRKKETLKHKHRDHSHSPPPQPSTYANSIQRTLSQGYYTKPIQPVSISGYGITDSHSGPSTSSTFNNRWNDNDGDERYNSSCHTAEYINLNTCNRPKDSSQGQKTRANHNRLHQKKFNGVSRCQVHQIHQISQVMKSIIVLLH